MVNRRRLHIGLVLAALVATSTLNAMAQGVPNPVPNPKVALRSRVPVLIRVVGTVSRPLDLPSDELAKMPRQSVRAKAHDGVNSQFEGIPLVEILAKAGVPTGKDLAGQRWLTTWSPKPPTAIAPSSRWRSWIPRSLIASSFWPTAVTVSHLRPGMGHFS